jgi:hypothetical protein
VLVPNDIVGLYLAKIFIHQYFSSINISIKNFLKPFFKNTKKIDQKMILDRPSYTKTLDEVRQFLIKIARNLAKIDTTLDKKKYGDKNLFAFEQVDGIEKCIGTLVQHNADHQNTPFEEQVMFNASFWQELAKFSAISNNFIRKSMAPEHAQNAFGVLASKLGRNDFNFSSKILFLFLSFIFKVCICLVKIRKKEGYEFKFKKNYCWKPEEVVDELLLNESIEYYADGQTETLHYSILFRNGSASDQNTWKIGKRNYLMKNKLGRLQERL